MSEAAPATLGWMQRRPRRRAWAASSPSTLDRVAPRARIAKRVLVVDDDPDILETLRETLSDMLDKPVEVATAPSGEEAKRRLEAGEAFDLVLTDERMPGMSGTELLLWLRTHRPGTVRVLMSAFFESYAARDPKQRAGAHTFLRKPFDLDAMIPVLRGLLATDEEPGAEGGP